MNMRYGKSIGKKFYEDGRVRRYPGNTVVADVTPGCPAYDVMTRLYDTVIENGFDKHIILLPHDSYHMTVIRGVNDQVRKDTHWPPALSKDAPMTEVDDYISSAVARAKMPGRIKMKFDKIMLNDGCMVVLLVPANEEQAAILKEFRDSAADEIGFRLPGHDNYRFHISLGYVRIIPEGEDKVRIDEMIAKMDKFIADQPPFEITPPYMAFYDDMFEFSPTRVPRDN